MPIDAPIDKEIDRLFAVTNGGENLDIIFQELAIAESRGIDPTDIVGLVSFGTLWWSQREPELQSLVCNSDRVRDIVDGDLKDLSKTIAELVAGPIGLGNAAKVGFLIAQAGLRKWCKSDWAKD